MLIRRKSMVTGVWHERELDVTPEQIEDYESGTLLQDAFPQLTPGDAEYFKTGITPEEWAEVFPPEPEDDDEDGGMYADFDDECDVEVEWDEEDEDVFDTQPVLFN